MAEENAAQQEARLKAQAIGQLAGTAAKAVPLVGKIPGFGTLVRKSGSAIVQFVLENKEVALVGIALIVFLTGPIWMAAGFVLLPILFPLGLTLFLVWFFLKD